MAARNEDLNLLWGGGDHVSRILRLEKDVKYRPWGNEQTKVVFVLYGDCLTDVSNGVTNTGHSYD